MSLVFSICLAAAMFAATNVDDLILLVGFFSDSTYRARQIVEGQVAGIAMLYGVSIAAAGAASFFPARYLPVLGLAPLAMGILRLRRQWSGTVPIENPRPSDHYGRVLGVALVTVANGGDNVATYTPVFAIHPAADVALMGLVFLLMTGLWCALASWLVVHPRLGTAFRRHGSRSLPYVLIGLGILIFAKGNVVSLLP